MNQENKALQANWGRTASEELKENVVKKANETFVDKNGNSINISTQDFITNATAADIQETLFMKILDGEIFQPESKFELTGRVKKEDVRLGNKEYKYFELLGTSTNSDGLEGANTIDDWNGEYIPEYAELFRVNKLFKKKVKLPELVLSNAWLAAERMVEFVQIQLMELAYALDRVYENYIWTRKVEEAEIVEVNITDLSEEEIAIAVQKATENILKSWGTVSDEHLGIGTDGVITLDLATGGAATIQPDTKFTAPEFTSFMDTHHMTDVEYNNEAQWFNFAAVRLKLGTVVPMDFSIYKGFKAVVDDEGTEVLPAVSIPENTRITLMHNDALRLLEQYEYQETLKGAHAYFINTKWTKYDVYRVKTKPIVFITTVVDEPAEPSKSAKTTK